MPFIKEYLRRISLRSIGTNIPFLLSALTAGFMLFTSIYNFGAFLTYVGICILLTILLQFDPKILKASSGNMRIAALVIACFLSSSFYTPALVSSKILSLVHLVQRLISLSDSALVLTGTILGGLISVYIILYLLCATKEYLLFPEEFTRVRSRLASYPHILRGYISLCVIYYLSISALVRANIDYHDDMQRIVDGVPGFELFSRHLMGFLSKVVNTGTYLADISPLTQILAVLLVAAASMILILTFSRENRITIWNLIAVLPLGLSPYFLECFSFKFDSPYMALTILASVFPLLFCRSNSGLYIVVTALCTLAASSIYQAALGIFPSTVVLLVFMVWLSDKDWKAVIRLILTSVAGYLAGMLLYRIFIMQPVSDYVSSEMFPLPLMASGVLGNLIQYFSLVWGDFDIKWILAVAVLVFSFIFLSVRNAGKQKVLAAILSICAVVLALCLSFGLYIALTAPSFSCRAMYGFGVCIAVIAVICSNFPKSQIPKLAALYLSWCMVVFSFLYGNALQEQVRYRDFRIETVLHSLNDASLPKPETSTNIQITGTIGISPIVEEMPQYAGVLRRMVSMTFQQDSSTWNEFPFYHYYGLQNVTRSTGLTELDLPLIHDGYYETIYSDGENILIELKEY